MPSFRRRSSVTDTDKGIEPTRKLEDASDAADALAVAEEAKAEAARARARAIRLRREAQAAKSHHKPEENPDGAFAASSVKISLTKVDGRWLINAFDPV